MVVAQTKSLSQTWVLDSSACQGSVDFIFFAEPLLDFSWLTKASQVGSRFRFFQPPNQLPHFSPWPLDVLEPRIPTVGCFGVIHDIGDSMTLGIPMVIFSDIGLYSGAMHGFTSEHLSSCQSAA